MGGKFKSKTHLLHAFFDFWRPFFARFASKFVQSFLGRFIAQEKDLFL
jgi:hypothetical protein